MLRKNQKFIFGDQEKKAFEILKQCLVSESVIHLYNPKLPTELHTDASRDGYGAILLQKAEDDGHLHPTYFYSKKTNEHERNYTSFELKVLAVVNAVFKLRVYLLNKPFKIVTDCKAFMQTMEKKTYHHELLDGQSHCRTSNLTWNFQQEFFIDKLSEKIKKCIENCIVCLISDRKRGKKEGYLHPIPKEDQPLQTYHLDHLGPMTATDKQYKYIFGIIDGFSKFCWLYATKTVGTAEVLQKLQGQQQIFGNPSRFITDHGAAFTANDFVHYCHENNIDHVLTTTGVPRGNGQIERLNSCIINVLSKLCQQNPEKWYKQLPSVQCVLNSTHNRAIGFSPFEVLFGIKMKQKNDLNILQIINDENL